MKARAGDPTVRIEKGQTLKDRGQTAKTDQTDKIVDLDLSVTDEKGQKHGQTQTLAKQEA
jgi:hypothetical protein